MLGLPFPSFSLPGLACIAWAVAAGMSVLLVWADGRNMVSTAEASVKTRSVPTASTCFRSQTSPLPPTRNTRTEA